MDFQKGFTLIELLIVIGILAVLATTVVLVLNPAEFMKKSRDTTRLSDISTLNKAISLYQTDGGSSYGTANTVYVSVPDTSATCANLGLPALSAGWSYACADSSSYRDTDGTGWVPVNLTDVSYGKILSILPVDPINAIANSSYYTYVKGSWKITAMLESEKYASQMNLDGGSDPALYEIGSDMSLANFQRGLVGYWKFDDGSGTTAVDSSGNGNDGTLVNGPTWTSGKIKGALSFDGADDYISIPMTVSGSNASISFWVKNPIAGLPNYFLFRSNANTRTYFTVSGDSSKISFVKGNPYVATGQTQTITSGVWHQVTLVWRNDAGTLKASSYFDGDAVVSDIVFSDSSNGSYITIGGFSPTGTQNAGGFVDEVRVYNRALSADEIKAMYNATR